MTAENSKIRLTNATARHAGINLLKVCLVLLVMPVLFGFTLPGKNADKKFDPDYLDFLCGKWIEKAVIKSPNGAVMANATTSLECVYDKEDACYRMTGVVRVADRKPLTFKLEFRRTSATEASSSSRYSNGRKLHGTLKQTGSNEVIRENYEAGGSSSMRAVTKFAGNTMTTRSTYYNAAGEVRMTAEVVSKRQTPIDQVD